MSLCRVLSSTTPLVDWARVAGGYAWCSCSLTSQASAFDAAAASAWVISTKTPNRRGATSLRVSQMNSAVKLKRYPLSVHGRGAATNGRQKVSAVDSGE